MSAMPCKSCGPRVSCERWIRIARLELPLDTQDLTVKSASPAPAGLSNPPDGALGLTRPPVPGSNGGAATLPAQAPPAAVPLPLSRVLPPGSTAGLPHLNMVVVGHV